FTGDEHHLTLSLPDAAKPLEKHSELFIAADEGGEAALALDIEASFTPARAHDLERLDWGVALEYQFAQVVQFEVPRDEPVGGDARQHAARSRALLQPGGHVGRVAHRSVVHTEVVADLADDDGTGVEPDSHLEVPLEPRRQLTAQVTDGALDRE